MVFGTLNNVTFNAVQHLERGADITLLPANASLMK